MTLQINAPLNANLYQRGEVNNCQHKNMISDDGGPFLAGYNAFRMIYANLARMLNAELATIKNKSTRATNTQEMANRMDEVIAKASKGDDKTREAVPEEVIKYMRDNGIPVDGQTIDNYIKAHDEGGLDKGSLTAIKSSLDTSYHRDADFMQQEQLVIQNLYQEVNAVVTQMTGLISKLGELLSMIAQKMF
ncbi:secretion protein [unidentified bacterial endosymbiont]|uniref:secretion protein n=1 Tax=unidentified bacterial endosymbiont TaxID=2355 RepID=UPI002646CB8D|nr:secretion protein [unidentified bacterial endosymbiont]